ncbi:hypothetical protein J2792_002308 [Novosphingobium capsulatum]|uniref:Lipoprotein n=1 Tax=Novosphingobium capsulatum TaxID=13688 RepID=A0ABU1MM78_9SPHN|nr:hypothetical protein [Novosphingobium capsulatum]MDR6511436.1 hypothetical protein [Novosphingobium capsulatum]
MRRLLLAPVGMTAFALMGCASKPTPPPAVEVRVEKEYVPVAQPCVDKADIPTVPAKIGGNLNGDAVHDTGVLGPALADMRAVAIKAVALLKGCAR